MNIFHNHDNKNLKKDLISVDDWGNTIRGGELVFVEVPEFTINENDEIVISKNSETEDSDAYYVIQSEICENFPAGSVSDRDDPLYIENLQQCTDETEKSTAISALVKRETCRFEDSKEALKITNAFSVGYKQGRPRRLVENVCKKNRGIYRVPKPAYTCENGNIDDLSWLINFRLDGLIKSGVLDDSEPTKPVAPKRDGEKRANEEDVTSKRETREMKRKPPFTYTELIECALQEKGPLTVSGIYQWISDTFPFYKSWDDRWKNSVRHNLSINPYFRKGSKAKQGSGHLWTVTEMAKNTKAWTAKRQRYREYEEYKKRIRSEEDNEETDMELEAAREAELAAANIEDKENRHQYGSQHHQSPALPQSPIIHSAGEILSGVKRNVAVEFIEPSTKTTSTSVSNDFLNPVSREVLMGECGFLTQIELNMASEAQETAGETEQNFEQLEDLGFNLPEIPSTSSQLQSLAN